MLTKTEFKRGSNLSPSLPGRGNVSQGLKSSLVGCCHWGLFATRRKSSKSGKEKKKKKNAPRSQAGNARAHAAPFWEDMELQEQSAQG